MIDRLQIRKFTIDLSTARNLERHPIKFTHLRVSKASTGDAEVSIRFENHENDSVDLQVGKRLKNWNVSEIWLTNAAQPNAWIELEHWGGPVIGPPEIVDDGVISQLAGEMDLTKASSLSTVADVSIAATSTSVIAAVSSTRREIIITNLSTNSASFRIGDSNAAAARGVELPPGASITLETTAAVYGYNSHSAAQSLSVCEVSD